MAPRLIPREPAAELVVRRRKLSVLDELRKVVPPPAQPYFADGNWATVEESLGTPLPADYKAFVSTYGAGTISGLVIHSPFIWVADSREIRQAWVNWASMYYDFADYGGVEIPYPVFPEAGGLLPFGSLADSHNMNWLTIGEADRWPFVYHHRDRGFFEIKGLSAVEFVLEVVTRRSPLLVWTGADSLFAPSPKFEPFRGL